MSVALQSGSVRLLLYKQIGNDAKHDQDKPE
jgi:hypothetical protein